MFFYTLGNSFLVLSVELGNTTTKCIVVSTDLSTGKSKILGKHVRKTNEITKVNKGFCETIWGLKLNEMSITKFISQTILQTLTKLRMSIDNIDFVVRSTGVTAGFVKHLKVDKLIRALAQGCLEAGIPPRKMIAPLSWDSLPQRLKVFSILHKNPFDGNIGELTLQRDYVANSMESALVTAGLKEFAKTSSYHYRNPFMSIDMGTTLAGQVIDKNGVLVGNLAGLAGGICDAIAKGINIDSAMDLNRKKSSLCESKLINDMVDEFFEFIRVGKVLHGSSVGKVPIDLKKAASDELVIIGSDIGSNMDKLDTFIKLSRSMLAGNENLLLPLLDKISAKLIKEIVISAEEESLITQNTVIGITGRAGLSNQKKWLIKKYLKDYKVFFAEDCLARGAAVLSLCMHRLCKAHKSCIFKK
jgi:putative methanogenesis marker protein 14